MSKTALQQWLGLGSLAYSSSSIPTSLPANGGNSATVNEHTVQSDVPENAVFTDTKYDLTDMINGLGTATGDPTDNDYFISQYSGGGETTKTYFRRPLAKLWNYIKSKADKVYSVLGHTHDDRYYTESEIDTKLNGKLSSSLKGSVNGLAELDSTGKVPSTQLPSFVDDVIEGYLSNGYFYKESSHTNKISGESSKIYIDLSTEKTYRWSGSKFVVISDTITLGETSTTAYRGDRGKTAYDHSQSTHARTDATKTEKSTTNGNIKINGTEVSVYTHPAGTNPHGTTKSDIGLGNVDNTADADKSVNFAKLTQKVKDYNGNDGINIGWSGDGLTKAQVSHFACYFNDHGTPKIKDTNIDVIKQVLGLGARAYDSTNYLPLSGGSMAGQILATAVLTSGNYSNDRNRCPFRSGLAKDNEYAPALGISTKYGTWTAGNLNSNEYLCFNYVPDTACSAENDDACLQVWLKNISGTIALESDIPTNNNQLKNGAGYITGDDSRLTNARPASDVPNWAKQSSKPSYNWSEINNKPSTFTPSGHTHNYAGSSSAGGVANSANNVHYTHTNEINFKGGKQEVCYFNFRNADTDATDAIQSMIYKFCNYSNDVSKVTLDAANFTGNAASANKANSIIDYASTNNQIQIGYGGNGISGDDIKYIAGYTTGDGATVDAKIKDVSKDALRSWLNVNNLFVVSESNPGNKGISYGWARIKSKAEAVDIP